MVQHVENRDFGEYEETCNWLSFYRIFANSLQNFLHMGY
jgi:hypothetical protein